MLRWVDKWDKVFLDALAKRQDAARRKALPRLGARCQRFLEPGEQVKHTFVGFFNRLSFERPRLVVVTDRRIVAFEATATKPLRPLQIASILPRATRLGPVDRDGFIAFGGKSMWIPEAEDRREVDRADAEFDVSRQRVPPSDPAPPWG